MWRASGTAHCLSCRDSPACFGIDSLLFQGQYVASLDDVSSADTAGGWSAGGRRLVQADLPRADAARPESDPLRATRFWESGTTSARSKAPAAPRPPIEPEVPEHADPAEILRRLAELAVAEASGTVTVMPDQPPLPRRSEAVPVPGAKPEPAPAAPLPSRRQARARAEAAREEPPESEKSAAALHSDRLEALARLMPRLASLEQDDRPEMRALYALCFSMLASGGQAPADREVWRTLLGLSKYDDDPFVRSTADAALTDLERHGTVPRAS